MVGFIFYCIIGVIFYSIFINLCKKQKIKGNKNFLADVGEELLDNGDHSDRVPIMVGTVVCCVFWFLIIPCLIVAFICYKLFKIIDKIISKIIK